MRWAHVAESGGRRRVDARETCLSADYTCTECGEPCHLVRRSENNPRETHFRHNTKSSCIAENEEEWRKRNFQRCGDQTPWHRAWSAATLPQYREVHLLGRPRDAALLEERHIFEYQHSDMSVAEFAARCSGLAKAWWVFHVPDMRLIRACDGLYMELPTRFSHKYGAEGVDIRIFLQRDLCGPLYSAIGDPATVRFRHQENACAVPVRPSSELELEPLRQVLGLPPWRGEAENPDGEAVVVEPTDWTVADLLKEVLPLEEQGIVGYIEGEVSKAFESQSNDRKRCSGDRPCYLIIELGCRRCRLEQDLACMRRIIDSEVFQSLRLRAVWCQAWLHCGGSTFVLSAPRTYVDIPVGSCTWRIFYAPDAKLYRAHGKLYITLPSSSPTGGSYLQRGRSQPLYSLVGGKVELCLWQSSNYVPATLATQFLEMTEPAGSGPDSCLWSVNAESPDGKAAIVEPPDIADLLKQLLPPEEQGIVGYIEHKAAKDFEVKSKHRKQRSGDDFWDLVDQLGWRRAHFEQDLACMREILDSEAFRSLRLRAVWCEAWRCSGSKCAFSVPGTYVDVPVGSCSWRIFYSPDPELYSTCDGSLFLRLPEERFGKDEHHNAYFQAGLGRPLYQICGEQGELKLEDAAFEAVPVEHVKTSDLGSLRQILTDSLWSDEPEVVKRAQKGIFSKEYRLFLLDVTVAEVYVNDADQMGKLRSCILRLDDPVVSCTICDRQCEARERPQGEACYVVHLWCRDKWGRSVCVLLVDAVRLQYRRLSAEKSAIRYILQELNEKPPSGIAFRAVEAHTTKGWHGSEDPLRRRRFAWVAIEQAREIAPQVLDQYLAKFKNIEKNCRAETRVGADMQALEAIDVKPGEWLVVSSPWVEPQSRYNCDRLFHAQRAQVRRSAEQAGVPPLRVLSFDIECYSANGGFPDATKKEDECIAIGIYAETLFSSDAAVTRKVLCLGETEGADYVECCGSEGKLLERFGELLQAEAPDVIVGYNQTTFDWKYLRERANNIARPLPKLSKLADLCCEIRSSRVSSSAMGDNPLTYPRIPGAFEVDLWFYLKRENLPDLPDLKLNTVAKRFLGEAKHDLPPQEIFACYRSGPAGRARVAAYCLQDTKLVLDLVRRLDVLPRVLLMARVVGVTPRDVLMRGQQIRVYAQLLRKAHALGFVVEDAESRSDENAEGYEGAHVLDPVPGFYREPIITVDFASLYPSIQRTFNLSPDTLVPEPATTPVPCHQVPGTRHSFVSTSHVRGILPQILDELLLERARAKREMARAEGLQRALLNSKQLALKISANSVYGFCGAQNGILQCREVAECTAAAGRHIITFASELIVRDFPGSRIVYGDTDSCFVQLPPAQRELDARGLFRFGEEMAERVNAAFAATLPFQSEIKLEMEKFLNPLILYPAKKRYAGLCFEDPERPGKQLVRGLELVRKDGIQITKDCQQTLIELLLKDPEGPRKAVAAVRAIVERVLALEPGDDLACVAQSKSLRSEYKADLLPHVEVNSIKRLRQPGSECLVGDRVAFVVIASTSDKLSDKAEDIAYAAEHKLPPDWAYYVDMVEKPAMRVLSVPLRSCDASLHAEILQIFQVARDEAASKVRANCMARSGLHWVRGRVTKKGGIQQTLPACFVNRAHVSAPRAAAKKRALDSGGPIMAFVRPRTSGAASSSGM